MDENVSEILDFFNSMDSFLSKNLAEMKPDFPALIDILIKNYTTT